jgi:hypothetical protein
VRAWRSCRHDLMVSLVRNYFRGWVGVFNQNENSISGEMSTDISTIFGLGFIDKFTYAYSLHVQAILC